MPQYILKSIVVQVEYKMANLLAKNAKILIVIYIKIGKKWVKMAFLGLKVKLTAARAGI